LGGSGLPDSGMTPVIGNVGITVAIGYAAAVLFFFARRLRREARSAVFLFLGGIVASIAVVLDTRAVLVRCVVGMLLLIFLLHMWDLHMDPQRGSRLTLGTYLLLLPDYAWSVARAGDGHGLDLPLGQRARDAAKTIAALCLVFVIVVGVFSVDRAAWPFWLEHAAKSTCLGALVIRAFQTNTALWRLAGAPAAWFMTRKVLAAHSPAEFWRRWNQPMSRWLLENVYKPLGGRRNPRLAVLGTFAVSGILHEYLFAVILEGLTGFMLAFFLLHGLATVVTRRFRPIGWRRVPAAILTFSFNTLSTVLLLAPINGQIPLYVNDIPWR
jgi:hypothetical protein